MKIKDGWVLLSCWMLLLVVGISSSAYSQTKYYAVQVAALRSEECANELVKGFRARQLEAYMVKVEVPKAGTFYRIRVGKFQNMDVARAFAEKLLDSGLIEALGIAVTDFEPPQDDALKLATRTQSNLPAGISLTPISVACPIGPPSSASSANSGANSAVASSPAGSPVAETKKSEDFVATAKKPETPRRSEKPEDYIAALGMSQKGAGNKKGADGKSIVAKMPPMSAAPANSSPSSSSTKINTAATVAKAPAPQPAPAAPAAAASGAPRNIATPVPTPPATPSSSAVVAAAAPPAQSSSFASIAAQVAPSSFANSSAANSSAANPAAQAALAPTAVVAQAAPSSPSGNIAYKVPSPSAAPSPSGNDVVLLMRAIDRSQWRLKVDVAQLARSAVPAATMPPVDTASRNKQALDAASNNINWELSSSLTPANLAKTTAVKENTIASNTVANNSRPTEVAPPPVVAAAPAPRPAAPPVTTAPARPAAAPVAAAPSARPSAPPAASIAPPVQTPPSSPAVTAAAPSAIAGNRPATEIRGPSVRRGGAGVRDFDPLEPIKLQGIIEMRNGQLQLRVKNLDLQRAFSGVARVTLSDDRNTSDISPVPVVLQPEQEVTLPVNETAMTYGDVMLLVYDERQAVQLIRSAPFGQKPASVVAKAQAAAQPDPDDSGEWTLTVPAAPQTGANGGANVPVEIPQAVNPPVNNPPVNNNPPANPQYGLPNVTGVYDSRSGVQQQGQGAPQPNGTNNQINDPSGLGPISLNPRQMGVTNDNVAMEVSVAAVRPPGYVTLKLQAGDYQDEKSWVMSSLNDRVPFLIPAKAAKGGYNFQVIDESGRLLAKSSGNFLQVGR